MRNLSDSILFVYCFDDLTLDILTQMSLPGLVPVSLKEFESQELLRIKPTRTIAEYCWTCTPHIIRHAIRSFDLPSVTYLDADLYFFNSPKALTDEWDAAGASILITDHRYTPEYDNALRFGTYCVQFMSFRADVQGMTALNWWSDRCIEWCYDKVEDGKFGDQKYLDDWTVRFQGVHVLRHLGGGVAPWNVQQYTVQSTNDASVLMQESSTGVAFNLVFYHFHGLKIYADGEIDLAPYVLSEEMKRVVYQPYIEALGAAELLLQKYSQEKNFHGLRARPVGLIESARLIKRHWQRRLNGSLNVQKVSDLTTLK
jgi:hypothetical protein